MKKLSLFLVTIISFALLPLFSAHSQTGPVKTTFPPSFGIDVGPANWSFASNKFSWSSGISNMTMNLPSLTVAVSGVGCAIAQSSVFSHNSSTYTFTYSGASVCNGVSLATSMVVHISNVTGAYNKKEVWGSATATKTGGSSIVDEILFPLSSPNSASKCNSGSTCSAGCFGTVCFDWSNIPNFSYDNSSKIVTAISPVSTASSVTYVFDPLAIDGSGKCAVTATSCGISLTTTNPNDLIIVGCGVGTTHCTLPTSPGLTFHFRASIAHAANSNNMSEWYAVSTGILSSATITCNLAAAQPFSCNVFGILGANIGDCATGGVQCFDPNAGIPTKATAAASNTVPTVTGVSTSNAADIIIGMMASQGSVQETAGSCLGATCTLIQSTAAAPVVASEYIVTTTTQSGQSVAFNVATGAGNFWSMIVDAIQESFTTVTVTVVSSSPVDAPLVAIPIVFLFFIMGGVMLYLPKQSRSKD